MSICAAELRSLFLQGITEYRIDSFSGDELLVQRLHEVGIRRGDELTYVGRAPFGGPLLFRMGAIVIALREEEFQCLLLQKLTT